MAAKTTPLTSVTQTLKTLISDSITVTSAILTIIAIIITTTTTTIIIITAKRHLKRKLKLKLLFVGPSGAGKSTLLYRLRNPNDTSNSTSGGDPASRTSNHDIRLEVVVNRPSSPAFFSSSSSASPSSSNDKRNAPIPIALEINPLDPSGFEYRDRPAGDGVRGAWRDCLAAGVDGVVFVVDAADYDKRDEAARMFADVLREISDEKIQIPVLVLGNKIDLPGAVAEEELRGLLGLRERGTRGGRGERDERENCEGGGDEGLYAVRLFMCSAYLQVGFREGFAWLASRF